MNLNARQPAEWEIHQACWLAWPSHPDLWGKELPRTRSEFTALCRAISGIDYPESPEPEEKLHILVPDSTNHALAEKALAGLPVRFFHVPFGDIWLRDTGPIFLRNEGNGISVARFQFNGWGGKYVLPNDDEVAAALTTLCGVEETFLPWILEGGSVDVDGEGTLLTSRQCLLNPNRNPGMSESQIEEGLKNSLGVTKVLWLREGLKNDHTDGHIDTLARFVAPGVVVCMLPSNRNDPNADVLEEIHADLCRMTDAAGRKLRVVAIPSPGSVFDSEGELLAASYVNFYIANRTVVIPNYGISTDADAVEKIGALFPGRKALGLPANALLTGGGAFHCITQQQPGLRTEK